MVKPQLPQLPQAPQAPRQARVIYYYRLGGAGQASLLPTLIWWGRYLSTEYIHGVTLVISVNSMSV